MTASEIDQRYNALSQQHLRILDWQRQVVEIINDLLRAQSDEVDAAIDVALGRTAQMAGSDRTYVFRIRGVNRLDNTHEWVADGIEPAIEQLQDLPDDLWSDWRDDLNAGKAIFIPDISALPASSTVRDALLEQNIKSLLVVPTFRDGILNGFVGYDSVHVYRQFLPSEIELICSVANTINAVIERGKAEDAAEAARKLLLDESNRLRATLEAIPDLMFELDADGRFVKQHSAGSLNRTISSEVLMGRLPEEVLEPERATAIRSILDAIDLHGQSVIQEYRFNGPDGIRWHQVSASAKEQGHRRGYILLIRDVTESRFQQAQISRLGKIAERTSNLVVVTDSEDRIEWVNPAFEKRSGWKLEELKGRQPKDFLQMGMVDKDARRGIRTALRNGQAFKGELLNKSRSGEEYWISIDITPLRDDQGALSGFVAVQTDITELKNSHERALEELAVAIEETEDAIFLSRSDGSLRYVNSAFRHLFGIAPDEDATTVNWLDFLKDTSFDDDFEALVDNSKVSWRGCKLGCGRNGLEIKLELSLNRRDAGTVIGIARDITERTRQEIEHARLRDELQIAQRKEMIAHLATGVAHDLNNLIAVVDGTADILESTIGNETELFAGIGRIRRATRAARDLVNSMSRLDRSSIRREPLDLRTLLSQAVNLIGTQRLAENFVTHSGPDLPCLILADPTDIQQVIMNLAINACDAKSDNRPNFVKLSITQSPGSIPTRAPDVGTYQAGIEYCNFVISDSGTGITAENRTKLFQRYFTTKGKSGTGLGMPVVASIIRDNEAALWFDSEEGKGSTVTVAWPEHKHVHVADRTLAGQSTAVNGGVKTGHVAAQNQASGGMPSAMARALPR